MDSALKERHPDLDFGEWKPSHWPIDGGLGRRGSAETDTRGFSSIDHAAQHYLKSEKLTSDLDAHRNRQVALLPC